VQITPDFAHEAAGRPTISPDGRYLMYERQGLETSIIGVSVLVRDIWVIDLQDPKRTWPLTTDGLSGNPVWSQVEPSNPVGENPGGGNPGPGDPKNRIYLPAITR
jgi:hypothetical protein